MRKGIAGIAAVVGTAVSGAMAGALGVSVKAGRTKIAQAGSRVRQSKKAKRTAQKRSRAANRR